MISMDSSEWPAQVIGDVEGAKEQLEEITSTLGSFHDELGMYTPVAGEETLLGEIEDLLFGGISDKTNSINQELEDLCDYIEEVAE